MLRPSQSPSNTSLVVSGMPGVGKSTVGALVAEAAGAPFVDTDVELARAHGFESAAAFIESAGLIAFRAAERSLVEDLTSAEAQVIAVGGGALMDATLRRHVLTHARVVSIDVPMEEIARRLLSDRQQRPLLPPGDPAALGRLWAERRPAYCEAHGVVDGTRSPQIVAGAVERVWRAQGPCLPLQERAYAAAVTPALAPYLGDRLDALRPTSVVLVIDEAVDALWGDRVRAGLEERAWRPQLVCRLPGGETSKRWSGVETILSEFERAGIDRGAVVVAVGGGVVCDMAGFAASLWHRGIRWIAVPTTLLAMVDASVGGKTAIDWGSSKNVVGTFHQPSAVISVVGFSTTLSARDYVSGLSEAVKTAVLGDRELFERLEDAAFRSAAERRGADAVSEIVRRCLEVKARVVVDDEREGAARAVLNFGHTVGHALEAAGGFERWTHGEAVAIGMAVAARASVVRSFCSSQTADRLIALIEALGLPTTAPHDLLDVALTLIDRDKKRRGDQIQAVWLVDIGTVVLDWIDVRTFTETVRQREIR